MTIFLPHLLSTFWASWPRHWSYLLLSLYHRIGHLLFQLLAYLQHYRLDLGQGWPFLPSLPLYQPVYACLCLHHQLFLHLFSIHLLSPFCLSFNQLFPSPASYSILTLKLKYTRLMGMACYLSVERFIMTTWNSSMFVGFCVRYARKFANRDLLLVPDIYPLSYP